MTGLPAGRSSKRLAEITVADFAIIKGLQIHWGPGFCALTGETGAGKSLLIDALGAALGRRAEAEWVRAGAGRAWVEAIFEGVEALPQVAEALEEWGCASEEGSLVFGRDLQPGRSTSRVNGRAVPSHLVSRLSEAVIDIHSQSDHLSLMRPRQQLDLLDRYGALDELRSSMGRAARELMAVRQELSDLESREREAEREAVLLRYQVDDIDAAEAHPGEEAELGTQRLRGKNVLRLRGLAAEVRRALSGDEHTEGALALLGDAAQHLAEIKALDESADLRDERLVDALDAVEELERAVGRYAESVDEDPSSLEAVEQRLFLLADLKRKYGATIEAVLDHREEAASRLGAFERRDERMAELRASQERLAEAAAAAAQALSHARSAAAQRLAARVAEELGELGLGKVGFEVVLSQQPDPDGLVIEPGADPVAVEEAGVDRVAFMIAANPGEPARPLARVASGGELSRLTLGLKAALAEADETPVLVFDELEHGVGGRMGDCIGEKLWALARSHQVLCVTHLSQVAAYADAHYVVSKAEEGGATVVDVRLVEGDERVMELAQMLGGRRAGGSVQASARELLERAARWKEAHRVGRGLNK